MAGRVGLLAAAGARIEGQTISVFETHPDLLGPQPQSLADHLLTNPVVARAYVRLAGVATPLAVLFERDCVGGRSCRRAALVKCHTPAAVFRFPTLPP